MYDVNNVFFVLPASFFRFLPRCGLQIFREALVFYRLEVFFELHSL